LDHLDGHSQSHWWSYENLKNNFTLFCARYIYIVILVDRIRKFNLFPSDNPTTANDEDELRHQIISTRLFLILFLISLIILSIYSSQVQKTITVTIVNPSMEQYISGFIISSPPFYVSDFRVFGSGVFCTIASFCQLSLRAISDGLLDFDESSFVTAQVVPHFS
jgi:hypothetical protein